MKSAIALIGSVALLTLHARGQSNLSEDHALSIYLLTLVGGIEWPVPFPTGDAIIGVFDDSELSERLRRKSERLTVDSTHITILEMQDLSGVDVCQIVYIPNHRASELREAREIIGDMAIMLVSFDADPSLSNLNFIYVDGYVRYEFNAQLTRRSGLIAKQGLIDRAVRVID